MMRKKLLAVIIFCSMLASFTACAQTPDEEQVTQKNDDKLIMQATEDTKGRESQKDIREKTPDHYKYSYENEDQTLSIQADADIYLPETNTMPMYRIESGGFDQTLVTSIYDYLFQGEETYFIEVPDTAGDISEEDIIYHKRDSTMQETEYGMSLYCETDEAYFQVDSYEPDQELNSSMVYESKTDRYYDTLNYMPDSVRVTPENADSFTPDSMGINYREARDLAEGLFSAADVDVNLVETYFCKKLTGDVEESPDDDRDYAAFAFYFTRIVDQVDTAVTTLVYSVHDGENQLWLYEEIKVVVDKDGIAFFNWGYPTRTTEKITEDTPVISFDEATKIFEETAPVIYEKNMEEYNANTEEYHNFDIRVDTIKLELIRVRSSDTRREGMYCPAWVFYGSDIRGANLENGVTMETHPWIIMAINAVDGSVIDISRGY